MLKKSLKNLFFVVGFTVFFLLFPSKSNGAEVNFSVSPLLPANQLKTNSDYYDVLLKQGQKQTFALIVQNKSEDKITIETEMLSAITNGNGVFEYTVEKKKFDETLKFPFNEIATIEKNHEIAPLEKKELFFQVEMPKQKFIGSIFGGVKIREKVETELSKEQIINVYTYLIPIRVQQEEKEIEPDLIFKGVKTGLFNKRNSLKVSFQNPTATIIRDGKIDIQVKRRDKDLYRMQKENMKFAPNSKFTMNMPINGEKFRPGRYELIIHYQGKNISREWQKEFTIDKNEAKRWNQQAIIEKKEPIVNYLLIVVIILLSVTIILLLIVSKRNKKNRDKK